MPLPVDVGEVRYRVQLTGWPRVFTFGHHFDAAGDAAAPDAAASAIRARWFAQFAAADMINTYTFLGCTIKIGTALGDIAGASAVAVVGTYVQPAMTPNVALLVHERTAAAGHQNRARMYLPPCYAITETDVTPQGGIAGASVTAVNTKLAAYMANMLTDTRKLIALTTAGAKDVTALTLDPTVATMRKRLR